MPALLPAPAFSRAFRSPTFMTPMTFFAAAARSGVVPPGAFFSRSIVMPTFLHASTSGNVGHAGPSRGGTGAAGIPAAGGGGGVDTVRALIAFAGARAIWGDGIAALTCGPSTRPVVGADTFG